MDSVVYRSKVSTNREVHFHWLRESEALAAACIPDVPPRWPPPLGSDPFDIGEVANANLALSKGQSVHCVSKVLAARRLARVFGRNEVRAAIAWTPMPMPPKPEDRRGHRGNKKRPGAKK